MCENRINIIIKWNMEVQCNGTRIMRETSTAGKRFIYLRERCYNLWAWCPLSIASCNRNFCVVRTKCSFISFLPYIRISRLMFVVNAWPMMHFACVCFAHVRKKAQHKGEIHIDRSGQSSISVLCNVSSLHWPLTFIYCHVKSIAAGRTILLHSQSYIQMSSCV